MYLVLLALEQSLEYQKWVRSAAAICYAWLIVRIEMKTHSDND